MPAHVAQWKIDAVEEIKTVLTEYPIIGLVDVRKIPGPQMQHMRKNLRGKAFLKVVQKTLLEHALKDATKTKKNIDKLKDETGAQIALVATDMNPFKLYKTLAATKTKAPAKGGEIAPEDIVVQKGETDFKPGPIIAELQKAGIPAAIDKGKVVIKSDKVLVKAGEVIPAHVAQGLNKLDIKPLTVGLNVLSVYENGFVYEAKTLEVDEEALLGKFSDCATKAFNLAMFVAYPTAKTVQPLIQKAQRESMNLILEAAIPVPAHIQELLAKAQAAAIALSSPAQSSEPAAKAPTGGRDDDKKDKEPENEKTEEDMAAGLGALFG